MNKIRRQTNNKKMKNTIEKEFETIKTFQFR